MLRWGDSVDLFEMTRGQLRLSGQMLVLGPLDGATETALPGLQTYKGLVLGLIP